MFFFVEKKKKWKVSRVDLPISRAFVIGEA